VKRAVRAALALALLAGAAGVPALRAQDTPDSVEAARRREQYLKEEQENRRRLEQINAQAREQRANASRVRVRERAALGELKRTERDLTATRRRLQTLEHHHASLNRDLGTTRANLQQARNALATQKAKLAARLRAMYKAGAGRELEFLLSTNTFAQLLARWDFLVMVAEQDRVLLEDIEQRKEAVQATESQLTSHLAEVQRTERATASVQSNLDRLRKDRASSLDYIRSQRQAYEAAAAELEKSARDLQRLIAMLEKKRREEEQRARAQGRAPEPYQGDIIKGRGTLEWPVRGPLAGRFGPETHPRFGTVTLNQGIDIQAAAGTPVKAVAKGRVEYTSDDYGSYGQIIILNHGDGFYTLYAHLSSIGVKQGEEVQPGQAIGQVGDSGTSLKGTVLHFEVRKGSTALDPLDWLK
jgi:murein hydrolase activator